MRRLAALAIGAAALVVARSSFANPLDTYGFGSRETAMGSAQTADTTTFAATFYNPASLAFAHSLDLGIGYFRVDQRLAMNGKDNGVDPVKGVVGGFVAPGTILGMPFAFGIAAHLPDDRLSRVRTLKAEIPRWELYDNRAQILFIASEVAIRPLPWLAVGGGIAYLSSTRGSFGISGTANLDSPYDSQLRHEVDADLTTVRIPMLGARVTPNDRISVGIAYRGEARLDLQIGADIHGTVDKGAIQGIPVGYTLTSHSFDAFHPRQLAFGSTFSPVDGVKIGIDFVFTNWASYKAATSATTAHLDLDPALRTSLGVAPDPKPTTIGDPGFQDRIAPHLGVEGVLAPAPWIDVALRAGYVYEKTPVPPQTGSTNFVDTDRHTLSAGAGVRFPKPGEIIPGEVRLDVHVAYMILPERTTIKANPADYVGDYTASGHQTNVGATLGVGF